MSSPTSLSPAQKSMTPMGKAPPGLSQHDLNSSHDTVAMIVVCSLLGFIASTFFGLRIYAKVNRARRIGWDDLTCLLGLVGGLVNLIAFAVVAVPGPFGKHMWNITLAEYSSPHVGVGEYVLQVASSAAFGFIKLSIFLFYWELFRPLRWARWAIITGASISSAFYLAMTILQFYYMTPRPGESFGSHFAGPMTAKSASLSIPTSSVGLLIDISLLLIPTCAVVQLEMVKKRKIRLMLIFSVGLGALVGGALSLTFKIKTYGKPDFSYNLVMVNIFYIVEMFLGVCIACTPMVSGMSSKPGTKSSNLLRSFASSYQSFRVGLLSSWSRSSSGSDPASGEKGGTSPILDEASSSSSVAEKQPWHQQAAQIVVVYPKSTTEDGQHVEPHVNTCVP